MEAGPGLTLQTLIDKGFGRVAEDPGREIVLGLVGRFWRLAGNVQSFCPANFTGDLPPGLAKAVWSFAIDDRSAAGQPVRIVTETRVVCADRASRVKFGLYWSLVRPFSGLIRIFMLRAIQSTCARLRAPSDLSNGAARAASA
jgi:hypothetical protein